MGIASSSSTGSFEGRTVVVTGGTGALGRGVTAALVAQGAQVVVPSADARLLETFDLKDHPSVTVTDGVDLLDEARVAAFYAGLPSLWASIHLVGGFAMGKLADTSAATFEKMWRLNALSCFLTSREAVAAMRRTATGGAKGAAGTGRIVNVAARPALTPTGGMVAYAASKAAVVSLTESLAVELEPEGLWVNAVAPSIMDTPDNRRAMPTAAHDRWPKVDEVARAIAFLASPDNALTTGQVLTVYGHA